MKIHYRSLLFILIAILVSATPLIKASASSNDINVIDFQDSTQLISAVNSVNTELVKLLISKGADVNAKDNKGYNALLYAVESNCYRGSNNADIIKLLITNGADINTKNPEGETILDIALACRQEDVINDLLKAGVNLWTPEPGKARVFFVDNGLKVDINVMVGNESKYLNKDGGVVLIDVEPREYSVSARSSSAFYYSNTNLASPIRVIAGEAYYFRVVEKEREAWDYLSSLVKDKRNYPIRIVAFKEAEAKKEIKELLKLKELSEEKKSNTSVSTEITKPNLPKPTNSAVKENSSEFFGYAEKLRELKKLKDEGLLTDKEYEQKRKAIIDKM